MLVEQADKRVTVKEPPCLRRGKVVACVLIVPLVTEPIAYRYGKSDLRAVCPVVGYRAISRLTQHILCNAVLYAVAGGYALRKLHYASIKERYAQLERVGHTHLIRLEQYIAGQPELHIEILLLCQLIG